MNKRIILYIAVLYVIAWGSPAYSTLIKYDVSGGQDILGYNLSGYVNIESDPFISTSGESGYILFKIDNYEFLSCTGRAYGESGSLRFFTYFPGDGGVWAPEVSASFGNAVFSPAESVNYVGMLNPTAFVNLDGGVIFEGATLTVEEYSILPQEISLHGVFGWPYGSYWGEYWGFSDSEIILTKSTTQPVPEPTTILLMGSGLIVLMGFSKKFKK